MTTEQPVTESDVLDQILTAQRANLAETRRADMREAEQETATRSVGGMPQQRRATGKSG